MRQIVVSVMLVLSACSAERPAVPDYSQWPASHAEVPCPSIQLRTFSGAARRFADARHLEYRERMDDPAGAMFVIILQNERSQTWITPNVTTATVAQFLRTDMTSNQGDREMFDALLAALRRCGA